MSGADDIDSPTPSLSRSAPANGAWSITPAPLPFFWVKPGPLQRSVPVHILNLPLRRPGRMVAIRTRPHIRLLQAPLRSSVSVSYSSMSYAAASFMEPTILLHVANNHYPIPRYSNSAQYQPVLSAQSSYLRSSAPRPIPPPHSQSFGYQPSLDCSSSSYPGSSMNVESQPETSFHHAMDTDYSPTAPANGYSGEYSGVSPASWPATDRAPHPQESSSFPTGPFEASAPMSPSTYEEALTACNRYIKQEEPGFTGFNEFYSAYWGAGPDTSLASYDTVPGHSSGPDVTHTPPTPYAAGSSSSLAYAFSPPVHQQPYMHAAPDSPSYMLTSSPGLQYPPTPDAIPRFVNPAHISPNLSPETGYAPLEDDPKPPQALDPSVTVNAPPMLHDDMRTASYGSINSASTPSELEQALVMDPSVLVAQDNKRRRRVSFTSSSEDDADRLSESSGSEKDEVMEQDDGADDDSDFILESPSHGRGRRRTISSTSSSSHSDPRRVPNPIPVPNLTKKSRGRRVPTAPVIVVSENGVEKNTRTYTCMVDGCGKCFARGEHLKRHVRSIHTNEKPHKCPYPGCGKDFSRHDNLGQHMRVHKNWSSKQRRLTGSA
ncbi:uncharacterized protein LAESUDRAFT_764001 [Laetiporus sulphureus 93-53]|uniref:C2H2-type domain-containing protein n=1 Tax=Laetiporus sulphureus 93-53 TaxID=1314785 RepID=A0A165BJK2_9APHY|nr:uncharacterized protein LAESUDRAFT_764001 [Laetiporus sulphureus 93-53]KZT01180.1 hypothetical protein LAESUDRAFT_764001 [Laetiporus sulphureus 93-53]